jgi:hypothetical protein
MTPFEQTQLDCEERARRIEQQWRELPALFAQWKATIGITTDKSNETVASRVLFHTAQDIKRIAERRPVRLRTQRKSSPPIVSSESPLLFSPLG